MGIFVIDLFLVFWFLITGLIICFYVIGKTIQNRVSKSFLTEKRKKFLIYLIIFVLSCCLLYVIPVIIDIFVSSVNIDKGNLKDALLALSGGLLGAICYKSLEKIE